MAFNDSEISNDSGQPLRGYEFTVNENTWRYTTSANNVLAGGKMWYAVPISDSGVKLSGDTNVDALSITAPSDIGPANLYVGTPPSSEVTITVFNLHRDNYASAVVEYVGTVSQCDWPDPGTVVFTCESLFASMERDGLRYGWTRNCGYALYDPLTCKVQKEAYAVPAVLLSAENGQATAAAFATKESGYFNGGFISWLHPIRGIERRMIEEHAGNEIRLFGTADGLYYGLEVTAYPGCTRTSAMCKERFNNLPNYGGCMDMDGTNPFDGNPVFN